jgi:hypothetical protein
MFRGKNSRVWLVSILLGSLLLWGCSQNQSEINPLVDTQDNEEVELDQESDAIMADVVSVNVNGDPNAYQFSVGIVSPDTGCEQYADWWEVLAEDGTLLYRRVLGHSHVTEQPFVRSGGPVEIDADTVIIVRAHMNTTGYSGKGMKGTVASGFDELQLPPDFAADLEYEVPQPSECAF